MSQPPPQSDGSPNKIVITLQDLGKHDLGQHDGDSSRSEGTSTCGICLTALSNDEPQTRCPACDLAYHEECWRHNLGCGAYGCSQVNALRTGPDIRITVPAQPNPPATVSADDEVSEPPLSPSPSKTSRRSFFETAGGGLAVAAYVIARFLRGCNRQEEDKAKMNPPSPR